MVDHLEKLQPPQTRPDHLRPVEPPPHRPGRGKRLIAAGAAVLTLGVGGLFAFRSLGSNEPAPHPTPSTGPVTPSPTESPSVSPSPSSTEGITQTEIEKQREGMSSGDRLFMSFFELRTLLNNQS